MSGLAPSPQRSPRSRTFSWAISSGVFAVAVLANEASIFGARYLSADETYVAQLAVQGALLLTLVLAVRLEGRRLSEYGFCLREPVGDTVLFASLLALLFLIVRFDPGFLFGFGKIPALSPWDFGYFLFLAPVAAVAQVGLFFGYLFRTLSRLVSLRTAILLSASGWAVFSTNFLVVGQLSSVNLVEYLLSTTVVTFVLGLVLAVYFYKARWSLAGPVALASGVTAGTTLLPVGVQYPNWEVEFAASLVASAVLLIVVGVGLRESRLQSLKYLGERIGPRRHRFRDRARDRAALRGTVVSAAVVGVVAVSFAYGLPTVLGTSTPILAIASGSMVPTLHRGDLVVVQHIAADDIRVGTIIVFSVGCLPSPTVHRVIRIVSTAPHWVFQTKGDANPSEDPCTVPFSDVRGAVVAEVPYLGFLILDPLFAAGLVVLAVMVPTVWRGERP